MDFSDPITVLLEHSDIVQKAILSILVLLLLLIGRWVLVRLLERQDLSMAARYRSHKTSRYIAALLAIVLIGAIWLQNLGNWLTYLGLLSAGLVVALSEPITNIAGWGFILFRRPFALGDRIQIGSTKGDVIDMGVLVFTLMEVGNWVDAEQSTGRLVHVPNAKVFSENVANYTQGFQFVWHEIAVTVTFESDWRKAKAILSGIANKHATHMTPEAERQLHSAASKFMIASGTLTPIVYTRVVDIGVELTLRFLSEVRGRRGIEENMWEHILTAFAAEPDIDFAYPTQRFYFNRIEGKADAGGRVHRSQAQA